MSRRSPIGVGDDGFVGGPPIWVTGQDRNDDGGVGRLAGLFQRKAERFRGALVCDGREVLRCAQE